MKTLVSINPELTGLFGHPYYWDCSLKSGIEDLGDRFFSFGNKAWQGDDANDFPVPVFSHTAWEAFYEPTGRLLEKQISELLAALAELPQPEDDGSVVYFYMGSPRLARELGDRLAGGDFDRWRFVVNLFSGYFNSPEQGVQVQLVEAAASFWAASKHSNLHVVVDSSRLQDHVEKEVGVWIPLVPTIASQQLRPATPSPSPSPSQDVAREPLRIVYPSDTHPNRGFVLLNQFLLECAEQFSGRIEFVVRLNPAEAAEQYAPALQAIDNVEISEGLMTEADYQDFLKSADYVLLPYPKEWFYYRTSSILGECFILGKPAIVMEDTWLADEVLRYRGGRVVESATVEGIRKTLEGCWQQRQSGDDSFDSSRLQGWGTSNNVKCLLEAVLKVGDTDEGPRKIAGSHELLYYFESLLELGYSFARERSERAAMDAELKQLRTNNEWFEQALKDCWEQVRLGQEQYKASQEKNAEIMSSTSWKLTRPWRWLGRKLRR